MTEIAATSSKVFPDAQQLLLEIETAENELKPFVKCIQRSKYLKQGPTDFYVNLVTLEDKTACVQLTVQGWLVVSVDHDQLEGFIGDWPIYPCETIHQLLSTYSVGYREKFAGSLQNALLNLQIQTEETI